MSVEHASVETGASNGKGCTSPLFTEAEKVALELSDRMTGMPHDVSDELFARLRSHYADAAIVELASIAALENYRSRFNRVFRVEPQGFFCVLPQAESPQA